VYSGIDPARFFPGPTSDARAKLALPIEERLVLFVGRLDPVKGLEVLLDACATLRTAGRRFKCLIVGDGPLRPWLAARIEELRLSQTVQPVGGRPLHELGDWYRASDLVVVPSHSEGVPNVLLEAMACGAPAVATAVGGIPEIAQFGSCSLVRPRDPAALARAIAARLDAPPAAEQIAYGRSHAESAANLASFLGEVVARVRRASSPAQPIVITPSPERSLQTS